MTHRLNLFLLVLALVLGVPYYWAFVSNPSRSALPHPLHMADLRALAASLPGPAPTRIDVEYVGWRRLPGNLHAAGSGLKRRQFGILSYRLEIPGSGGIVIDTGTTAQIAGSINLEGFMPTRQQAVDQWMARASLILATSESPDHLGGLAAFAREPGSAVAMSRTRLNRWQVPGETLDDGLPWPSTLLLRPAITDPQPLAIAPGVVAIPAGTPTPGSQMFYVRQADGREFILAGDVAPFTVNFRELRTRSHWVDRSTPRSQRAAQMRWLVTLHQLYREAPRLIVLPGHDIDWLTDPMQTTGVSLGAR